MTSKIIVNTIEADTGISSVTFASNINLQNDSSVLVSSSGIRLGTGSTIAAPSANEIALSTNSAERLRLTSAGKIGVGVASPSEMMEITNTGGTGTQIQLRDTSTGTGAGDGVRFGYNGSGAQIWNFESTYIRFATNNAERLRITSDGQIGMGIASPTQESGTGLHIRGANGGQSRIHLTNSDTGDTATDGFYIISQGAESGSASGEVMLQQKENKALKFATNNVERLRITSDGKVGINIANPSHVLDVKSQADQQYFINGKNHNGNNIFQVYESSDGDGNHGMLYLNNGSGTTLTKISTNGPSYFNGGSIGINITTPDRKLEVVDTNSNGSYPLAVSNFINATANKGAAIDFRLTTGGNSRGEIGCKWTSNSSSDGTAFYFAPNDGSTGNVERMRITHDGYVLKSDTPAFKCKLSGATGANFTGFFVFGNVSYNIGNHYNSSNGRFTAPVDGRYLFSWYTNMERAGGNGSFYADWYINNNAQGNRMYTHHSGAWELIGGTVIFDLNASDYVQIKAITSGNWDGGQYGSYSGYLLG
jgi:ribosomal protein L35